jgi:hypothetical protein
LTGKTLVLERAFLAFGNPVPVIEQRLAHASILHVVERGWEVLTVEYLVT